MSGVVYKQWYVSVSDPESTSRNVAHLKYIATRAGTVFNVGCGFGLWGKLKGDKAADTINDLSLAQNRVVQMGKEHKTIHRAIISLDEVTALEKDFYNRESWQKLLIQKIDCIAKESNMDISADSFEWVASYHNEWGHPHCHINFWDNSDKIRNEYIPHERFEIMAENIRASFNAEIYRDELKALRTESDRFKKEIKSDLGRGLTLLDKALIFDADDLDPNQEAYQLLCGAMVELNPKTCFNNKLSKDDLIKLSGCLDKAIMAMPAKGRLDYAYLPKSAKAAIDGVTELLLENSDYQRLASKYIEISQKISEQYGNSEASTEHNTAKAMTKLKTELGNLVVKNLKQMTMDFGAGLDYFSSLEKDLRINGLSEMQSTEDYSKLLDGFSDLRLPMSKFMNKGTWKLVNKLVVEGIGEDKGGSYISLVLKLYDNERFSEAHREKMVAALKRDLSLIEDIKKMLSTLDELIKLNENDPTIKETYTTYRKNLKGQQKDVNRKMVGKILSPLKKELSSQLLESVKREKGWYDFSDKLLDCNTAEEVNAYRVNVGQDLSKRIKELIQNDTTLSGHLSAILSMMPKRRRPFSTFYDETVKQGIDKAVMHIASDNIIRSASFDYIDCVTRLTDIETPGREHDEAGDRKLGLSLLFKEINREIISHCVDVKDWESLYKQDMSLKLAITVFSEISQCLGQEKNRLNTKMAISKDMSKSQKKATAVRLSGAGMDWEDER